MTKVSWKGKESKTDFLCGKRKDCIEWKKLQVKAFPVWLPLDHSGYSVTKNSA